MDYTEIEIEGMKEILRDKEEYIKKLEEENRKLRSNIEFLHSGEGFSCMERIDELEEKIRFLEECLDNKEKVNKSMREELEIWKLTAKDYAKQCGVELKDLDLI